MRNFKEFLGVFANEDDILGTKKDSNGYIQIDLNSICVWNQGTGDTVTVDIQGGSRYEIDINYADFCKLMKDNQ